MLRYASLALAVLAVLALLWIAGEQHRENCILQERGSCSVLPWDAGEQIAPWNQSSESIREQMFGRESFYIGDD